MSMFNTSISVNHRLFVQIVHVNLISIQFYAYASNEYSDIN